MISFIYVRLIQLLITTCCGVLTYNTIKHESISLLLNKFNADKFFSEEKQESIFFWVFEDLIASTRLTTPN